MLNCPYLVTGSAGLKLHENFLKCNIRIAGPVRCEGIEGLVSDGGDVLHLLLIPQSHLNVVGGQLGPECGIVTQQGCSGQLAISVLKFQF